MVIKSGMRYVLVVSALLSCLLTGCGKNIGLGTDENTSHDVGNDVLTETTNNTTLLYSTIKEISIPDNTLELEALLQEGQKLGQTDPILHGENVWKQAIFMDKNGNWQNSFWQVLKSPYTEWEYIMQNTFWRDDTEYHLSKVVFSENENIYCILYTRGEEENTYYLGTFGENGVEEILHELPSEHKDGNIYFDISGNAYTFDYLDEKVEYLDDNLIGEKKVSLPGRIHGILQSSKESDVLWYGVNDKDKITVRNLKSGDVILDDFDKVSAFNYLIDMTTLGQIYITDSYTIWKIDEEPAVLCDFLQRDYIVTHMYDLVADETGRLLTLVDLDEHVTLLEIRESEMKEEIVKQEIVYASTNKDIGLERCIARFNRQNEEYHISVILPEAKETDVEFRDRIKLEMSAGRGPDIMGDGVISELAPYVENGYLECLDGILEDESQYLQAALEGSRIDGKLYGMPYDCLLTFAAYSQNFTEGRNSWTTEEFIKAVRASEAKVVSTISGINIVRWYGLYDNSNTAYIDWKKGESHLTEEPFLELLSFAKEYADTGILKGEAGDLVASGDAVAVRVDMWEMSDMNFLEACFQGDVSLIGFPRAEGNGIYVNCKNIYVNTNSNCKEGIKLFLRYLMSEEGQIKYIDVDRFTTGGWLPQFPVHLGAYESLMQKAQGSQGERTRTTVGIMYDIEPLTNEQVEQFYWLIENAQPDNYNAKALNDILIEELTPYFAGDVTAEHATKILDNRVQLYLDERVN